MKKLFFAMVIGCGMTVPAFSQTVTIYQKNGDITKYKAEEIDKILFQPAKPFDATNLLSEEYIPCEGFREWIDQNLGNGSGYYSLEEAAAYTGTIDLSRIATVTDITGIEYFTGLTVLKGEDGYFGNFNVGALKNLEYLQLVNTRITELDFTGLENLRKAAVSRNKLTYLNLAQNPNLEHLYCDSNELTSLDLTGCTSLVTLVCSYNSLTSLTLPECPLETLAIHRNQINSIDISKVAKTLDLVSVNDCGLRSLDCTGASKMTYLDCGDNPLTSAPILAGCSRIETLRMEDIKTEMGEMDFSDCSKLNILRLDNSKIGKSICLTKNKKLYELSLQNCGLEEIDVAGLINLGYVNVSDNTFKKLDVSSADGIFTLFANRNAVPAEIKVWSDFNIMNPEAQGFYIDDKMKLVYEFSN